MKASCQFIIVLTLIGFMSCSKVDQNTEKVNSNNNASFSEDLSYESNITKVKIDTVFQIPDEFLEFEKNSKGFCLVKGNSGKKQLAFTFDDGPTEVSLQIIQLLEKYNARATFFWVGEKMKDHQEIIELATQKGHLIANHSWNQPNGVSFSNEFLWETQVEKCYHEFEKYGIDHHKYYRPPFGAISQEQIDFLASKNIKTVLWSITTSDWDNTQNSEGMMFSKFKKEVHNDAIVLLHDFDFGNLNAKLVDLENMLKYAQSHRYQMVTIEDLEL